MCFKYTYFKTLRTMTSMNRNLLLPRQFIVKIKVGNPRPQNAGRTHSTTNTTSDGHTRTHTPHHHHQTDTYTHHHHHHHHLLSANRTKPLLPPHRGISPLSWHRSLAMVKIIQLKWLEYKCMNATRRRKSFPTYLLLPSVSVQAVTAFRCQRQAGGCVPHINKKRRGIFKSLSYFDTR